MRKVLLLGLLLVVSNANALDVGVGVKAGTLGVGVDLSVALTQTINARVSLTKVNIDSQNETFAVGDAGAEADIDTNLNFDFGGSALLFDWYVFDGTFHLTGGMLKNNGKISMIGTLKNGLVINGQPLAPSDINGSVGGSISAGESYKPYVGLGWGRKADDNPGFSVSVELGVALLDPKVDLTASVNAAGVNSLNQAQLNSRLNELQTQAENDLSVLKYWPVVSLGLNYAF